MTKRRGIYNKTKIIAKKKENGVKKAKRDKKGGGGTRIH